MFFVLFQLNVNDKHSFNCQKNGICFHDDFTLFPEIVITLKDGSNALILLILILPAIKSVLSLKRSNSHRIYFLL